MPRIMLCAGALILLQLGFASAQSSERLRTAGRFPTVTPIKHIIVIVGENRSFDHVFGLYRPEHRQTVSNLLSTRIMNADGTPGPNFSRAAQFQAAPQSSYYIRALRKAPYATLPPPIIEGAPAARSTIRPRFTTIAQAAAVEPGLQPADEILLTTGATGFLRTGQIDTRVANYNALPNGPFQLTGPALPYDSYTGDTVHRFFQMWQQSDCGEQAASGNATGCLSDLYPFVAVTYAPADRGGGNPMAVYNVNHGDAPYLKKLADEFSLSDNFHQSFMGGTGGNHIMLGTGDDVYFSDGNGNPATPPANHVANPNPQPGTVNRYVNDSAWADCSDLTQAGIAPIVNYLHGMGLRSNCVPGRFYMIKNTLPGFLPNGAERSAAPGTYVPPLELRTIGDALTEKDISWAYYGGAFDAARRRADGAKSSASAVGAAYCQICNPFQYTPSIMANSSLRAAHLKDVVDLFHDLASGALPAVSFVKPDAMTDGHPASSKLDLFEAFLKNVLQRLEANPGLERDTAVFITFDESGGYYDSGYIQPLDFFGDGPRIPLLAVSEYSRGGRIIHTYYDHVSILKFIERNWKLSPLGTRSRDNLPNPVAENGNPYIPRNRPAIGDLFEMFNFRNFRHTH